MFRIVLIIYVSLILLSCSNDDSGKREYAPEDVLVGIKYSTNIDEIFQFINQFDHRVANISTLRFGTNLPADSLNYILNYLNEKNYTNDGRDWFVTGSIDSPTNRINIRARLFDMDNQEHQNDWINSMEVLELYSLHNPNISSGVVFFKVPIGSEKLWVGKFENFSIVDWAELNYINSIERGSFSVNENLSCVLNSFISYN